MLKHRSRNPAETSGLRIPDDHAGVNWKHLMCPRLSSTSSSSLERRRMLQGDGVGSSSRPAGGPGGPQTSERPCHGRRVVVNVGNQQQTDVDRGEAIATQSTCRVIVHT